MGNSGIAKQTVNGNRNMVPKLHNYEPQRNGSIHSRKTYSNQKQRKGDEVLKDSRATSSSRIHQPGLHG